MTLGIVEGDKMGSIVGAVVLTIMSRMGVRGMTTVRRPSVWTIWD